MTREQYTKKHLPLANAVTKGTGIFPETLLAIAIIETQRKDASGNYQPGTSILATKANNHFAIKATPSWNGNTIRLKTPNDANPVSTFRAYPTTRASFADFVRFLQTNPRYKKAGVFSAPDWQTQIIAIARAGYAEGAGYAKKLKSIVNSIKKHITPAQTATSYLIPLTVAALVTLAYIYSNKTTRRHAAKI